PATSVQRVVRVVPEHVHQIEGRSALMLEDAPVPIVPLASVLGPPLRARPPPTTVPAVVVESDDETVAFTVDDLVDEDEIVVRPLGERASVPHITGGALLSTGRIALLLGPDTLVAAALR